MLIQDRLKSFVLRRGRITSNQKRALTDLWDQFVINSEEELKKSWADQPSALDIGFGAGETTASMAKKNPEMLVLGAEVYLAGIGSLLNKADTESLENIKILNADIAPFLEEKVANNCFDLILMFYPDPWPKRKHHKRRIVQEDFLDLINSSLMPRGFFYCKTDWEDYAKHISKVFESVGGWNKNLITDLEISYQEIPSTSYERKALKEGRLLNNLIYEKFI